MNSENSKTSESHRFRLDLTDKLDLKDPKKNMALANLSIYYTWKNIKSEYNNNKLSAPTTDDIFDLPDGSYPIGDIQDYFEFIIKKYDILTENPPVQIYPNKIKNKIIFKIKTGCKLELLTPETMKLLGSGKKDVDKDKDGENVPKLESVEVVLVHCNLVKNDYQHTSKVLFTFVPNEQLEQLRNISPHPLTMMNTVNTEFSSVEVWFTDQVSKALEIENNVNLTLIIEQKLYRKYDERYDFLSFARKFGDKYRKKLMDTATSKGINDAKTASKRVVQKTAEATGHLIGNKIADKITSIDKPKEKEKIRKQKKFTFHQKKDNKLLMTLKCFEHKM